MCFIQKIGADEIIFEARLKLYFVSVQPIEQMNPPETEGGEDKETKSVEKEK